MKVSIIIIIIIIIAELSRKTIVELIGNETKTMVFKSLNDLAPQYLCNRFTKKTQHAPPAASETLRLIEGCHRKVQQMDKNVFLYGELNYGIAFLLSKMSASSLGGFKNQYKVDYFILYCKYHVIANRFLIL